VTGDWYVVQAWTPLEDNCCLGAEHLDTVICGVQCAAGRAAAGAATRGRGVTGGKSVVVATPEEKVGFLLAGYICPVASCSVLSCSSVLSMVLPKGDWLGAETVCQHPGICLFWLAAESVLCSTQYCCQCCQAWAFRDGDATNSVACSPFWPPEMEMLGWPAISLACLEFQSSNGGLQNRQWYTVTVPLADARARRN